MPLYMPASHGMPSFSPHYDIDSVLGHGVIESATLVSAIAGLA